MHAMDETKCAGFRTSGHWRGYPCCAIPKHKVGAFMFCANHAIKAMEGVANGHSPNCPASFGFKCDCEVDSRIKEGRE